MKFSLLVALIVASFSALANTPDTVRDARNVCIQHVKQIIGEKKNIVIVDSFADQNGEGKAMCVVTTQVTKTTNKEPVISTVMYRMNVDFKNKSKPEATIETTYYSN